MKKTTFFSSRVPDVLEDNALARVLAVRRASGLPIHDLTLSNPTQADFDYPSTKIAAALAAGAATAYDPHPRGLATARKAIAQNYYGALHGVQMDPARLHLASGTSESYGMLFKLLGDAGSEILAPRPSYPLIEHLAALDGWRAAAYPLNYVAKRGQVWRIDFRAMEKARTKATRAIAVIHPHNPAGAYVHPEDACKLRTWCAKHAIALIADEVFLDYPASGCERLAKSFATIEGEGLVFTLGGLSKCAAMPQLKLAWIHVGGSSQLVAQAQARLDFIVDAYLSVSTPVQAAAKRLLGIGAGLRAQIAARIEENYKTLKSLPWPVDFEILPREAGWSALLRRPAAPDEELLARTLLDRAGVLAHPGYFFDFPDAGWHVLSLLPDSKVFRAASKSLLEWLPRLV